MLIKQVGDFMIPLERCPKVKFWQTLKDAITVMETSHVQAPDGDFKPRVLLVFDELNVLVGFLRRRDIMRGLEPDFLVEKPLEYRKKLFDVQVDPNLTILSNENLLTGILKGTSKPIYDVMQPVILAVNAEDNIVKAIYEMVANNLSFLPVIENDEMVGIVRSEDVMREIAEMISEQE